MAEEKRTSEKHSGEGKKGAKAKKTGAKRPAAKKTPAKKAAKKKEPEVKTEEAAQKVAEKAAGSAAEKAPGAPRAEEERELSEEELRRLVEESLERVTVADIILNMMNQLASVGYLKMGLPESVNSKYRDLTQARLAIDILEAMIQGSEGKVAPEALQPFRGTLANLQLNFVQTKGRTGGA